MRVLEKNEVSEVSGGTFRLLGWLFGKKSHCAPAPKVCAPAPKVCAPKPRKGC